MNRVVIALLLLSTLLPAVFAQEAKPVPIGKGSYAEFPPTYLKAEVQDMVKTNKYSVVNQGNRAIPTNQWWTDLLMRFPGGRQLAYPFNVTPNHGGVELFYLNRWNDTGNDIVSENPLTISGTDFTPTGNPVKEWSDWAITFRMPESDTKYMDVTIGRGMPYVWMEFTGITPVIKMGAVSANTPTVAGPGTFFDEAGKTVAMPFTGDHFGIDYGGRTWGVFAPDNTTFTLNGDSLAVKFPGAKGYLVVGAMPKQSDLAVFYAHAYALPRNTEQSYKYDPVAGKVTVHWQITTEALKGTDTQTIQGWLPHHYRTTERNFDFNGMEYLTPRGTMKCSVGNSFDLVYRFNGIVPTLPAPEVLQGVEHPYDPTRMAHYLSDYAKISSYGGETYGGGKDLTKFGQYAMFAQQMGDPTFEKQLDHLRTAMTDWFTYTPGEREHFFARYPNWHALVGFSDSYWSYEFVDHQFHYGYFTYAAAMLAMMDPQWAADYGPMAKQVAKEYANWDRNDKDYPYMRTFDKWEGHSWAGGISDYQGNNEESSSEEMQSWGGLFLLGQALDDKDMTAAGAAGYAMASQAVLEYWFNVHGDNFSPNWPHPICSMVWGGGLVYGTYFSGDRAWFYGIQWLPISPILNYLVEDPAWAKQSYTTMIKERNGDDDIEKIGTGLGQVLLGYIQLYDQDYVAQYMDKVWADNSPVGHDADTPGLTYYYCHSNRMLGPIQWDYHTSIPTSTVYYNDKTKTWSYVIYNPRSVAQLARVFDKDKEIGCVMVPAHKLTRATTLTPAVNQGKLVCTIPAADDKSVAHNLDTAYFIFSEPVDAKTAGGISLKGPGVTGFTVLPTSDASVVTLKVAGRFVNAASYTVTVPTSVKTAAGKSVVGKDYTYGFTVAPEAPLTVSGAVPANGQERVPTTLKQVEVDFTADVDAKTLSGVTLEGKGVTDITPVQGSTPDRPLFDIQGTLQSDESYALTVPTTVISVGGKALTAAQTILFTTVPAPCPPAVYGDSFSGGGYLADNGITVDFRNSDSPHTGKFAMKITATQDGTIYFLAGTSDNGDGRVGLDLSNYDHLEFWIKGDTDHVWAKVGHPVYDHAFNQILADGITNEYKKYTLAIPSPKTSIGTLFAISIPAGKTVYIDDVKYVAAGQ